MAANTRRDTKHAFAKQKSVNSYTSVVWETFKSSSLLQPSDVLTASTQHYPHLWSGTRYSFRRACLEAAIIFWCVRASCTAQTLLSSSPTLSRVLRREASPERVAKSGGGGVGSGAEAKPVLEWRALSYWNPAQQQ